MDKKFSRSNSGTVFFSASIVLQLLWVFLKVPETKRVSLEELEKRLVKE
ncbi:MAG: hypothetical protein WD824_11815 [Cyclobacteriaceae bacterium]